MDNALELFLQFLFLHVMGLFKTLIVSVDVLVPSFISKLFLLDKKWIFVKVLLSLFTKLFCLISTKILL